MKRILISLVATIAIVTAMAATYRPEDVPNVHLADRTRYVSNPDGILSDAAVDSLNHMLGDIWSRSTAEPVIVAIGEMADGYDENSFANDLFELWGIGKKDTENGLLLLIVGDTHRWVVRTGRGLGGVLPDVVCSRIMRHKAVPLYKDGDMDGGTIAAMSEIASGLTSEKAATEIRSKYANNAGADADDDSEAFFRFMIYAGIFAGAFCLIWVLWIIFSTRGKDDHTRYRRLNNAKPVVMFLTFIGLGMPLPALLICIWKTNRLRNHPRNCPNCSHRMRKLDEVTDNNYLTPAQDMEEKLNSVDYDVWLCDQCGEKDVIPYINRQAAFTVCEKCGARTCSLTGNRIIQQPTTRSEGHGIKIYSCRNCDQQTFKPYNIAKLATPPVVIIPGSGGGSGFGGGGFSGGSFGGGGTSGGGASGGW